MAILDQLLWLNADAETCHVQTMEAPCSKNMRLYPGDAETMMFSPECGSQQMEQPRGRSGKNC